MAQQTVLPGEELTRKAGAIKVLSLGFLAAAVLGEIITVIIWLLDRTYPVISITILAVVAAITSLLSYWLVKTGRVKFAGYFFIIVFLVEDAVITVLVGGSTGPVAMSYLIPILVAGMVIGINASFLVATVASVLYLVMLLVEQAGLLPPIVAPAVGGDLSPYMIASIRILLFYLVAFLSWFTASRLNQALQSTRRYAGELRTANEKLQASEEELRTANEELEAANEELRATEEELRSSNEELEAANEELRETQEQLVRSERLAAIGQLAGGVGHELRNPLGAIKNAVYYIRGKVAGSELAQREPRVAEFLEIVDDEVKASNKIINDLLGFSRVGKPAVSPARIEKVINDAIAHTQIPENVNLSKKVDGSLPEIEVDTDQICQVLVNVLTNAVQAMPQGGRLTVVAREKNGSLELEIADTGYGIAEENVGKIFDPLYTMKAKGIGLGLAVCKTIVERHEGSIGVESEVDKGTTFTIKLPLTAG